MGIGTDLRQKIMGKFGSKVKEDRFKEAMGTPLNNQTKASWSEDAYSTQERWYDG